METNPSSLSDRELLTETRRIADHERHTTASLVSLLAEVDVRRLYLAEGYSSMFTFCTAALRLSESAAYARITAARAARRFPAILELLHDGAISLTTVSLLAPHLEDDNHGRILDAARHRSKREVERLVAGLQSQPDIPSSIRALPMSAVKVEPHAVFELPMDETSPSTAEVLSLAAAPAAPLVVSATRPSLVAPVAPKRYLVRMTVSDETHRKLERARDLLRRQIPDGDPAGVFDLALTALIEKAERTKFAARKRPRRANVLAPRRWRPGRTRTERLRGGRRLVAFRPPCVALFGTAMMAGAPLLEAPVDAASQASSSSTTSSPSQWVDQAQRRICSSDVARTMRTRRRGNLVSGG